MPLEIRELVIKAQVGNTSGDNGQISNDIEGHLGQEELIKQCVEKVLEIIQEKSER